MKAHQRATRKTVRGQRPVSQSPSGGPPIGRQLDFTFLSAPDPLFKASKAPFLTFKNCHPVRGPFVKHRLNLFSGTIMTGRPGHRTMEMNGGSSVSYLTRTPCVPSFCTLVTKGGKRGAFRLPGEGGDHFHCTVEPSSSHIWCRFSREESLQTQEKSEFSTFSA